MKTDKSKMEFAELLNKATQVNLSLDVTESIMNTIQQVAVKKGMFKKYIKRSWFFIGFAILLALKAVSYLDFLQLTFSTWVNSFLPGAYEFFTYTLLSSLAGLFFYQLNSLLENRTTH